MGKSKQHSHRSNQNKVKKAHNRKKNAGPNQPTSQILATTTGKAAKKAALAASSATGSGGNKNKTKGANKVVAPPKLVAFIALHDSANPYLLKSQCLAKLGHATPTEHLPYSPVTVTLPPWAQPSGKGTQSNRITLLDVASRDKFHVLDAAKVADVVVLCMGPNGSLDNRPFDDIGYETLSCLKSQGIPTVVGAIQGLDKATCNAAAAGGGSSSSTSSSASSNTASSSYQTMVSQLFSHEVAAPAFSQVASDNVMTTADGTTMSKKQRLATAKLIQRFFESEFSTEERIFDADSEMVNMLRHISNTQPKDVAFRRDRGYFMVEQAEIINSSAASATPTLLPQDNQVVGENMSLKLSGYLRGAGICTKNLIHISGVGDFPIQEIAVMDKRGGRVLRTVEGRCSSSDGEPEPSPSLTRLRPYDPSQNEQHIGQEDEEMEGGMNDIGDTVIPDAPESAQLLSANFPKANNNQDDDQDSNFSFSDLNEELFRYAEECPTKKSVEFEQRALEDLEFPDEVDTPLPPAEASTRYQKYRGLRSLKTSHWDRYEELPLEYSRIWEFEGFKSCANAARQQQRDNVEEELGEDEVLVGRYVVVTLGKMTEDGLLRLQQLNMVKVSSSTSATTCSAGQQETKLVDVQGPVVVSSLFEHEHLVSVMHLQVHRCTAGTDSLTGEKTLDRSVKSKTEVEFHCGFRRFLAKPIFSQLPKKSSAEKDKHLYQRYLHPGQSCVASIYAPILFPPCTVLMFEPTAGAIDKAFEEAENTGEKAAIADKNNSTSSTKAAIADKNTTTGEGARESCASTSSSSTTLAHMMETEEVSCGTEQSSTSKTKSMPCITTNISAIPSWTEAGRKNLLGWGEVIDANPKKIIVKRSILTGYPFRVHKNKAVVRHMFFRPDDIRWFRPVELRTKHGLRGNIKESLGTHGYMKCVFGDRIKQNDTICMDLYKRQFPKWYPPTWGGKEEHGPDSLALG
ncbi:unnamed protein product [Amoebophrya sp. A25]|nr:unnamed protein product [Amoebophrya sp. A25]|eukprot:GSA25T00006446001.1